jgi:uncharacterized protein
MLVFDLRSLTAAAATVDDVLPSTDPVWQPDDSLPRKGVSVQGRLSGAGSGRFYFSGQISGVSHAECRRCLAPVDSVVSEHVQLLFAEAGAEDDEANDPDVSIFDPRTHELDMRPAIREQWLLSIPTFIQCREDCAGLCATCGSDLNGGPCGCEEAVDPRWAGLKESSEAESRK